MFFIFTCLVEQFIAFSTSSPCHKGNITATVNNPGSGKAELTAFSVFQWTVS